MKKQNGVILYQGPSLLDSSPIAVIATLKTSNRKTGGMAQSWILKAGMSPIESKLAKADVGNRGSSSKRQNLGGDCYVNLGQAPLAIYRAFKKGVYS